MIDQTFSEIILNDFVFQPTQSQFKLFDALAEFIKPSDRREILIIKGYAGTGKTSSIASFLRVLPKFKIKSRVLAPTGRAAKVISVKSGKDAFTIHKQIYRRKSKVDLNSPVSLNVNLFKDTIFVVDEASMIGDYTMGSNGEVNSRNLLEDLMEYVFSGKGCKLILMGDDKQLPPVGSDYSPALNAEYLMHHFSALSVQTIVLDEVLRQAQDSEILKNATLLRRSSDRDYPEFEVVPNSDFVRLEGQDLQFELENCINSDGTEETIIITRSNKRANLYNQQIRARILWFEEELCSGDCLMVVRNNYFWMGDDTKMGFVANGELMMVKRILKYEEYYGFRFARILVSFIDYEEVGEVELIILLETLQTEGPSLPRERMRELFFEVEKDYAHIREKKKRYEAILSDPYFNALQVKYAYAVTCHKSQGGQWKNVFIDQGYVPEEQLGAEYLRWLYTAITRATDKVYLVNFEDKFFKD